MPEQAQPARDYSELAALVNRVFANGDGMTVLDYLDARFRVQRIYQAGGMEAQRETERRAAQKEVIDHIFDLMRRAQQGDPNE